MDKDKAKTLVFWQSKAFFTLKRDKNGFVHEQEVGLSRPRDAELVKGGRNKAYTLAERLWPGTRYPGEDDSEAGEADKPSAFTPGLPGEKPSSEGKGKSLPVESHRSGQVSEDLRPQRSLKPLTPRPVRITPRLPRITGGG